MTLQFVSMHAQAQQQAETLRRKVAQLNINVTHYADRERSAERDYGPNRQCILIIPNRTLLAGAISGSE